jgi:hypothetical protein
MAKRIIFIAVWAVTFFFGSAVLLGFAPGLLFTVFAAQPSGGRIDERMTTIAGISWALVPMIVGPIGLLLGIFGKLPGTRRQSNGNRVA